MKITCMKCKYELGSLDVGIRNEPAVIPMSVPMAQPEDLIPQTNPEPDTVCWNGDTRSAYEFQEWRRSGEIKEDEDHGIIWEYSDGGYIDLYSYNHSTYGKSYHVLAGVSEESFKLKLEAEIYLWNVHSRCAVKEQFGLVRLK